MDFDISLLTSTDSSIVEVGGEDTYNVSELNTATDSREYQLPFDDVLEPCLSPANPFNEPAYIFHRTRVDAELFQLQPNNRLSLRKDNSTGLYLVKGEESIGLTLNYNSNEDNGYTGYTTISIVHSHPSLHSIRVQTKDEKLPFTISTDGFRHTTERVSTTKYGDLAAYTFHVANCKKKTLQLKFSTLSSKGDKTCIPGGKSHASRQWDIIISTSNDINDETYTKKIPIQVVAEVTGASRAPEHRRRAKRALLPNNNSEEKSKHIKIENVCTQKSSSQILFDFREYLQKIRDYPDVETREIIRIFNDVITT